MEEIICSTTKKKITNTQGSVTFACPNCGKTTIVRSGHARSIAAPYKCSECKFEGP